MAIELEIIVYGGGDIFRQFFNAIALSMGSNGYESLIKLSLLFGGIWALTESIVKRNYLLNAKWLISYMLIFYVLFLPKVTVHIIDRVQQGKAYAVDNVPLGLGVLASYTSRIGDGLTRLTETNFSMPDYQPYGQTGMVMASRMVKAAGEFQITDPAFNENLQSFVQQCVFYDLLLDKYSVRDLLKSSNIWSLITANASPARSFLLNRQITTCQQGAATLTKEWQKAIDEATSNYGRRLFAGHQLAKQELLKRLPMSYAYLTKISEQASTIMQQNMMANVIKQGLIDAPPHAQLESYAITKAQMQKRLTNSTIGDMAAYWLPIMKIVFEAIMYGSFIFVFLVALFPVGLNILKHYLYSLLWIQIWAPLYAIINLIVSFYAQTKSGGAVHDGLSLISMTGLSQVNADIAGMAGYISISIPFISTIIVKGMAGGFTQLAQYIGGVAQSVSMGAAGEAASGNISLGNTSFGNSNAFNTSANHFDTNAKAMSGSISYQLPTGSIVNVMPSGHGVINNQPAISSLGTSISLADSIRTSGSKLSEQAFNAAMTQSKAMVDHYAAGMRSLYDLGMSKSHSASDGSSSSVTQSGGMSESANQVSQLMTSFGKEHNLTRSQTERVFAAAYADANVNVKWSSKDQLGGKIASLTSGTSGETSVTTGVKGELSTSSEKIDANIINEAKKFTQDHNFSQLVDRSLKAAHEENYRSGNEHSNRLTDSISSSFDLGNTLRNEVASSYQKSQAYREMASISNEYAASINSNANQQFVDWLGKQHAPNTDGNIGVYQAENMRENDPVLYKSYVEQFMHEQTQAHVSKFEQQHHINQSSINTARNNNNASIPGIGEVIESHAGFRQEVENRSNSVSVSRDLNNQVEVKAKAILDNASQQLAKREATINAGGSELKQKATSNK